MNTKDAKHIQKERHWRRAGAIAIAAALTMTGCGVGGASGTSDLTELQKSRIAEDWRNCMAEGGLDATINYEGGIDIGVGVPDGITDEQALEIEAGCETILEALDGSFDIDPDDQAQLIDAGADLQKCMAEAGFDVEISDDGGISVESDGDDTGVDDAALEEAETGCYKKVIPDLWAKYGGE